MPARANAEGLIECLCRALEELGPVNLLDKADVVGVKGKLIVVGGGTDGATVNVAEDKEMKCRMKIALPWLFLT